MFMTNSNDKSGELLGQERRRRWSPEQKLAMVRESLEPGQSVSVVARRNGINANQLFLWRKLYQDGSLSAVSAGEAVVPASELSDALTGSSASSEWSRTQPCVQFTLHSTNWAAGTGREYRKPCIASQPRRARASA